MKTLRTLARLYVLSLVIFALLIAFTPAVPYAAAKLATDWYEGDADVLVVLGGSMLVSGTGSQATMGYDTYLRCVYAWWNMQRFKYSYVVVTGSQGLAESMAAFFRDKGVNPQSILLENKANNTYQNCLYVQQLLQHLSALPPTPRIAVLTSDYHCRRASLVFQHLGLPVRIIPAPDLAKRAHSPLARCAGFISLGEELTKYVVYRWNGKL